jgi:hypothetical protein
MCILSEMAGCGAQRKVRGDITVRGKRSVSPGVVFATEGETKELSAILARPKVIPELEGLHAGIALAIPEFTPERARLVQKLNEAGIPVTAWLALPKDEGYYLNASNAMGAAARFAGFEKWSAEYELGWAGVGLDIEPNIQEFAAFWNGHKLGLAWLFFKRYFEMARVKRARREYAALIRKMQADGYPVETYQFPFLADERKEHTTVLERLTGIVDVRGNVEVLMIYTSFHPSLDSAMIWAYGSEAQAIAVGVTNRAANAPGFRPLDWDAFWRDMIVASHFTHTIGVYNLEGCAEQGFLPRMEKLNWDQAVTIPAAAAQSALVIRGRVQTVLWLLAHLLYFAAAFLVAILCAVWWWVVRRRTRSMRRVAGAP